jgi:hypothetical protein
MMRKLVMFIFVVSVATNSIAAVSPHLDGDGGCSAVCCQAARRTGRGATLSKLCCLADCKQPSGTQAASPSDVFVAEKHKPATLASHLEDGLSTCASSSLGSSICIAAGPTDVYLKTGALLI